MNASSTDIVEKLERLGFILIAALVPSLRFSGVLGFRICGIKCSIQQLPVCSRNARGFLNWQTRLWSSGVKTWLQPLSMHPSTRRCLHVLVPVKR